MCITHEYMDANEERTKSSIQLVVPDPSWTLRLPRLVHRVYTSNLFFSQLYRLCLSGPWGYQTAHRSSVRSRERSEWERQTLMDKRDSKECNYKRIYLEDKDVSKTFFLPTFTSSTFLSFLSSWGLSSSSFPSWAQKRNGWGRAREARSYSILKLLDSQRLFATRWACHILLSEQKVRPMWFSSFRRTFCLVRSDPHPFTKACSVIFADTDKPSRVGRKSTRTSCSEKKRWIFVDITGSNMCVRRTSYRSNE